METKQYYAYYRLSKRGDNDGTLGIDAQKAIINHFYKPIIEKEEIKSAKDIYNRPVLQEAIKTCIEKGYYLVVAKVDRLSRNVDDCRAVLEQLNGRLICCDIPGNLDKFTLTLYAAFAERERELIALRTSQALQAKIKLQGHWRTSKAFNIGSVASKGHKASKEKALNNDNNKRASSVVCSKLAEKWTLKQIAAHLNEKGFKTSEGKQFSVTQVVRIKNKFCK